MQATIFGLVFLPLALAVTVFARHWLPALVVFSAVFQGSSVFNVKIGEGDFGISPYIYTSALAAVVFLLRISPQRSAGFLRSIPREPGLALVGYVVIAAGGAFLLPILFKGTPVNLLIDRHGMDRPPVPLSFTLANAVQAFNLCAHGFVLLFLAQAAARNDWRTERLLWGLGAGVATMAVIGLYERLAPIGDWPSTLHIWMSNPGYIQHTTGRIAGILRISAPMSEASYASAFIGALLAGLFSVLSFGRRSSFFQTGILTFSTLVLGLLLLNTLGTTGWVAAGVSCLAVTFWLTWSALRSGARQQLRTRAILVWMLIFGITATSTWIWRASPVSDQVSKVVDSLVLKKQDTNSAKLRNRSNENALKVVRDTYGLGVGLGSNRASSFFASLVSNTGIVGALLFVGMLSGLLWRYARAPVISDAQRFVAVALATATLAMGIAIPDLNLPLYWIFIFLAFLYCPAARDRHAQAVSPSGG